MYRAGVACVKDTLLTLPDAASPGQRYRTRHPYSEVGSILEFRRNHNSSEVGSSDYYTGNYVTGNMSGERSNELQKNEELHAALFSSTQNGYLSLQSENGATIRRHHDFQRSPASRTLQATYSSYKLLPACKSSWAREGRDDSAALAASSEAQPAEPVQRNPPWPRRKPTLNLERGETNLDRS